MILRLLVASLLLGSLVATPAFKPANPINAARPTAGRPNILFILVDDMGWGDLGVFWQNQRK